MKTIGSVFRFTFLEGVRKKAFVVSTILICILLLAMCLLLRLLASDGGSSSGGEQAGQPVEPDSTCYVVERGEKVPGLLEALSAARPDIRFTLGEEGQLDAYRSQIEEDGGLYALVVDGVEGELPSLTLYAQSFMSSMPVDDIAQTVKNAYVTARFAAQGVPDSLAELTTAQLPVTTETVGSLNPTGYVLGILVTVLMFSAIYMYGYWVAMSVASEKTSRVMETLVVSCKPSRILIGKCLGMGVLGLFQLAIFLVVAGIGLQWIMPGGLNLGGAPLSLDSLNVGNALLLVVYFVLGYALYALLNSVCGATVSRAEDIQVALTPVTMITMIAFFVAYYGAILPGGGGLTTVATYVPFTSPFVIPYRLLNEAVPVGELVGSIAILLVAIVAVAALSIRLYTVSVLHYGQRLKLGQLFRSKM